MDWQVINNNIQLISAIVGGGIGLICTGWSVLKYVVRPVRRLWAKAKNEYLEIKKDILTIKSEIQHNGGGSIKDAIARIEKSIKGVELLQRVRLNFDNYAFFEASPEGKLVFSNKSYLKFIGADDYHSVLGFGWLNYIYHEDKERVIEDWDSAVKSGSDYFGAVRYITPDREIKCGQVEIICIRNEQGEVIRYMGRVIPKDLEYCNQ